MPTKADTAPPFFEQLADDRFRANAPARGPWSADHCHAGPVAGLIARALEQAVPGKALTRMTLDLARPTPVAGFRISTHVRRDSRTIAQASAELYDDDGHLCISGSAMFMAPADFPSMPTTPVAPHKIADAQSGASPLPGGTHGQPSFTDFIDVAYPGRPPEDPMAATGPAALWMKTPPLLAGERPTGTQRLCPLADCGNGISRNAGLMETTFMNTDLTIHIHRQTQAEWFLSDAVSHWQKTGIGLAQAVISDDDGPVATALQTVLLRPPPQD